jgi:hypothetical protein
MDLLNPKIKLEGVKNTIVLPLEKVVLGNQQYLLIWL